MSNPDLPITMECDMWHCHKCGAPCVDFVSMGPEEKKVCIKCVLEKMESLKVQLNTVPGDWNDKDKDPPEIL